MENQGVSSSIAGRAKAHCCQAGHFKQTKSMAITEALLNVGLSCILVMACDTVSVVIGTVVAMGYRTVCYATYASGKLLGAKYYGVCKADNGKYLICFGDFCAALLLCGPF
ncbi:MAG: hypothetical protein IJO31_08450 [Oscillospiraceae bacterium]|nr:hypothetical protein [Oscillospiraceae bacterium]